MNCHGEAAEALLVGGLAPNTKPLLELNFNQFTQTEYRQNIDKLACDNTALDTTARKYLSFNGSTDTVWSLYSGYDPQPLAIKILSEWIAK